MTITGKSRQHKGWWYAGIFGLVFTTLVVFVQPVNAGFQSTVLTVLGWITITIVEFLGNILLLVIEQLIGLFQYSGFINTPAVELGWVIMRDLGNMAIVVALLIIAFATVFRTAFFSYSARQLLVRLIFAAILVNFSRLIAGLLISAGQALMGTFVNGFKDLAAGNLTVGFGIEDMLKVATGAANSDEFKTTDFGAVIGAMILAVIMLVIAIGVVLAFIVILLQRIIFLWLLVIFSPVAYIAPLLPGAGGYASQWWSNFTKQVFIGPVIAFGFWLSMSVLAGLAADTTLISVSQANLAPSDDNTEVARLVSQSSSPQALFDFFVTIGLLLGTLKMATSAGGLAGQMAGRIQGKLESTGVAALRGIRKGTVAAAKGAGTYAATRRPVQRLVGQAQGTARKLAAKVGMDKSSRDQKKRETELARAEAFERAGGSAAAGTVAAVKARQRQEAYKELEETGRFAGGEGAIRQVLKEGYASNDRTQVEAALQALAKDKSASVERKDYEDYEEKYGLKNVTNFEGDVASQVGGEFLESVKNTDKASGNKYAEYDSGYTRDTQTGKLERRTDDGVSKKVQSDFAKKDFTDLNSDISPLTFNADLGEDGKPQRKYVVDAMRGLKNNLGKEEFTSKISQRKREVMANAVKDMLANAEQFGIEKEEVADFRTMYDQLQATYVRGKREDVDGNKKGQLADRDLGAVATGKTDEGLHTPELDARAAEMARDTVKLEAQKHIADTETPTDVDLRTQDLILKPIVTSSGNKNDLQKIYEAKARVRKNDTVTPNTEAQLDSFIKFFEQKADKVKTKTKTYNKAVNRDYTPRELLEDSKFYKSAKRAHAIVSHANSASGGKLTPEERKELENVMSVVTSIGERADRPGVAVPFTDKRLSVSLSRDRAKRKKLKTATQRESSITIQRIGEMADELVNETNARKKAKLSRSLENQAASLYKVNKNYNPDEQYNKELDDLLKRVRDLKKTMGDGSQIVQRDQRLVDIKKIVDDLGSYYKPKP